MSKGLEALEELLYYANLNFERENERKTEFTNKLEQMDIADNEENFKIIKKYLEALEIIKEHRFLFVEKGQLYVGRYADTELLLEENDFQDKQEYELLKEAVENDK